MSIDLTVVTMTEADLGVAQRLAECALDSLTGVVDLGTVPVFRLEDGFHEYDGEFVFYVAAPSREPASYLAALALGASVALLYGGRLVDDAAFFPPLSATEVLRRCFRFTGNAPSELWESLAVAEE